MTIDRQEFIRIYKLFELQDKYCQGSEFNLTDFPEEITKEFVDNANNYVLEQVYRLQTNTLTKEDLEDRPWLANFVPEAMVEDTIPEDASVPGGLATEVSKADLLQEAQGLSDDTMISIEERVQKVISDLKEIYREIYAPLESEPPEGVLCVTDEGYGYILGYENYDATRGIQPIYKKPNVTLLTNLYNKIHSTCNTLSVAPPIANQNGVLGFGISPDWIKKDGRLIYNYYPHLQLYISLYAYADASSGQIHYLKDAPNTDKPRFDRFYERFSKDLRNKIYDLLSFVDCTVDTNYKTALNSIFTLYSTTFVVTKFDKKTDVALTMHYENEKDNLGNIFDLDKLGLRDFLEIDAGKVIANKHLKHESQRVIIAFDFEMYKKDVNFAHKSLGTLIRKGGAINLKNLLIGNTPNADPITLNMVDESLTTMSIDAASRSGKGTLTWVLISNFFASGTPFVYADNKPDMARQLWQMEKENGAPIVAIDGMGNSKNTTEAGYGLDDVSRVLSENYDAMTMDDSGSTSLVQSQALFTLLPYVKLIQLAYLVSVRRAAIANSNSKATEKPFYVILDEALMFSNSLQSAIKALKNLEKEVKNDKNDKNGVKAKFVNTVIGMFLGVPAAIKAIDTQTGGTGNVHVITIGQSSKQEDWGKDPGTLWSTFKASKQFLFGRGSRDGGTMQPSDEVEGFELLDTGYFIHRKGKGDDGPGTMVKTLCLLNKADYGTDPTSGVVAKFLNKFDDSIRERIIEEDIKISEETYSNFEDYFVSKGLQVGDCNPLISIAGFTEALSYYFIPKDLVGDARTFEIQKNMSAGYAECYEVLRELGIIGPKEGHFPVADVYNYLYSADSRTIFPTTVLAKVVIAHSINPSININNIGSFDSPTVDESYDPTANENDPVAALLGLDFNSIREEATQLERTFANIENVSDTNGNTVRVLADYAMGEDIMSGVPTPDMQDFNTDMVADIMGSVPTSDMPNTDTNMSSVPTEPNVVLSKSDKDFFNILTIITNTVLEERVGRSFGDLSEYEQSLALTQVYGDLKKLGLITD